MLYQTICSEIQQNIDLYLDGEFTGDMREVRNHTHSCISCSNVLKERKRLKLSLRNLSRMDPSKQFKERLEQALSDAEIKNELKNKINYFKVAFFIVATILIVLGIQFYAHSDAEIIVSSDDNNTLLGNVNEFSIANSPIVIESVNWHLRSAPMEITGSEEEVLEWFRPPKINFPLRLPEMGSNSELLGGRLGNIHSNDAAIITYKVDNEDVSVILFNNQTDPLNYNETEVLFGSFNGYNVAIRKYSGITYVFTSTMLSSSLTEIANDAFDKLPNITSDVRE